MFFVYVLENLLDCSWYIGFSTDAYQRVRDHNQKIGGDYTGRKIGGWRLIYYEAYLDKIDALGREKFLKSGSGRRFLKKQLFHYLSPE